MSLVVRHSSFAVHRCSRLFAFAKNDVFYSSLSSRSSVVVKPVFVHLHHSQQSGRAFSNFGDQLCRPVKLAIMFFTFKR